MSYVSHLLYSKEILNTLRHAIVFKDARSFSKLDPQVKDKLVALAMQAFQNDVEIILSKRTTEYFCDYINSNNNYNNYLQYCESVKQDMHECFSDRFDIMIDELREEVEADKLKESGFALRIRQNGEAGWSKYHD